MLTIIHPIDDSTEFLLDISSSLMESFKERISYYPINSDISNEEVYQFLKSIKDNEIILFLGHGGSSYLCRENRERFITKDHLDFFDRKFLFCLSCLSNEFLKHNFSKKSIINAIGFGDLPTDWNDVSGAREFDANAYENINEVIISEYCQILVELVIKSFNDLFNRNLDFKGLNSYFRLHLNKKISDVILRDKSNQDNRILADLLYDIKSEMRFF